MRQRTDASRTFPAAPLDANARFRLKAGLVVLSPTPVLGVLLLVGVFRQEGALAALLVLPLVLLIPVVPIVVVGMLPTGFELEGEVVRVRTRWFGARSFRHVGRAELFRDPSALRRRGFFGSGEPRFNRIVTATMGLPPGKVYFALTDRDRSVLVPHGEGSLFVSPENPVAFCRAISSSTTGPAV